MPGHFDLRSLKQDSPEVHSSPDSEYYTPSMQHEGFSNTPSTVFRTPQSTQISPERANMYHHFSPTDSPSVSPSPSPTESMFSRPSRPDSATSESADESLSSKRPLQRQRSTIPSLIVTDCDSDEERKPEVDASPIQETFAMMQARAYQRSMELRAEAMAFHPNTARDSRQITSSPLPSAHGNFAAPAVRPQARAIPQYTLPPRSHPFTGQAMNSMAQSAAPATVAPRYKQAPAFQVVPRRFPTPKPILAMRMATGPQQAVQPMPNIPQARVFKPQQQQQQQSTLYDSRGQTFEGKAVTIRPPVSRVPAMPLSSVRHLWPVSGAPLPTAESNSTVWHPSSQEARSILSIQQARILKGFPHGIPHGGGLYLPIPFDETFA